MFENHCLKLKQFERISQLLALLACVFLLAPQPVIASEIRWIKQESKHFVVFYQKASEGREILKEAERVYPRITSDFNYYPARKINIYAYHSHSLFLSKSPSGITRAYSQPFMNNIVISATQESIESAVAHELTHIVFLQSLPDSSKVPFWFVEGIAIYESQLDEESTEAESYAFQGDIPSVSDLSKEKPEGIGEQQRVAAEGYMMINYIVDKYGKDGLNRLIKNLQRGMDFSIALEKSSGVSEEELNKAWYEYAAARSMQIYIQNLRYFGFLILGLLAVLASGIWLARKRQKQKELEEEAEGEGEENQESEI